ncbi:hypothetical protein [Clostridium intestinale]|uniref:YhfM-like domain-containing protein n=1 Tax=Clostridium intestinale URNW TaxID=1294142 RepID=U2Q568_9CLOT|nr:hypothetical protein [Clostridium intestinale]ERK31269.1 hypothetical protein CINTURNW_1844 [Clostridium intestinale URNW]
MKKKFIYICLLTIFLVIVLIYFFSGKFEGNLIIVEKQTDKVGTYEYYSKINDPNSVKLVKNILNKIYWSSAKVDMPYPPDYQFYFMNNDEDKSNRKNVSLWISTDRNKVALIFDGKYIQLNEEKSNKLFEILTGKKLE